MREIKERLQQIKLETETDPIDPEEVKILDELISLKGGCTPALSHLEKISKKCQV